MITAIMPRNKTYFVIKNISVLDTSSLLFQCINGQEEEEILVYNAIFVKNYFFVIQDIIIVDNVIGTLVYNALRTEFKNLFKI